MQRAVASGELRADVTAEELLRALIGMCYLHDQPGWQATVVRLINVLIDGLLVRGSGATPTRLVLFRRPIEHRCETRSDLEAMILTVVVEQIAELLNVEPSVIDPRYERD